MDTSIQEASHITEQWTPLMPIKNKLQKKRLDTRVILKTYQKMARFKDFLSLETFPKN